MTTRTERWPQGTPCWADISVSDLAASRRFYGAVLGWEFVDQGEDFGHYHLAEVGGVTAAGLGPLMQEGQPSAWTLYFATDDVDVLATRIVELGGSVLFEPMDVGPSGRMAIGTSPDGAVFGLWQARDMIGAGIVNAPGGITWEDLRSTEPDAAREFYGGLFGLAFEGLPMAAEDYTMFAFPGGDPLGGIGGFMGQESPASYWLVYFGVSDVDAALESAGRHGGATVTAPFDSPYGRMAGIADPDGAVFFVVEMPGVG